MPSVMDGRNKSGDNRSRTLTLPFGAVAFIGAFGSLIACYGTIAFESIKGMPPTGMNPHAQAAVMWGFGLVAIWGLVRDRRQHGRGYPLLFGAAGVAVLVTTLYIHYDMRFEVLAYVLLVVGALLNQTAMVTKLHAITASQKQQIEEFNSKLEQKVDDQVQQIQRLNRLRDFLPPSVAELVLTQGREALLDSHRQYIACLFCDIRNFTGLAETLEPEEVIGLLRNYHDSVGELVAKHNGTIGYRAGDGLMVFFNDPIPCEDPVLQAVQLGLEIECSWRSMRQKWHLLGGSVGIGIGIASGYATLGLIGREGRADYTAIGNVVNLASRLCDDAGDGELLLDHRTWFDVEHKVETGGPEERSLEGIGHVAVHRVERLRNPEDLNGP